MEKTFAIIKPDAVARNISGRIISKIEENGFTIIAMKKLWLTKRQAEGFYAVHTGKPFFDSLTTYMSSGPCIAMVLQKDGAIAAWRKLMGAESRKRGRRHDPEGICRKPGAEQRPRLRRTRDRGV